MIISIQDANQLLQSNKDVLFADCRFDLSNPNEGEKMFLKKHIKRAVYFDLEKHLSGEVKKTGGRHPLPNIETFTELLAEKGIDNETIVIAYDQNRAFASRFFWMMKYIGHQNVYILNGGLSDWENEGFETENGSEQILSKKEYGPLNLQENFIVDQTAVAKNINRVSVCLVDSRNFERYAGKHEPIDKKAGHIPNAKNYEWTNVLDDHGKFRSKEELINNFRLLKTYDEIIVYCGSGVTAAPNAVALMLAGFENVRLYIGSFSDWITNDDNEVATL